MTELGGHRVTPPIIFLRRNENGTSCNQGFVAPDYWWTFLIIMLVFQISRNYNPAFEIIMKKITLGKGIPIFVHVRTKSKWFCKYSKSHFFAYLITSLLKPFYSWSMYLKTIKNTIFATEKPKLGSKSTRIWVNTLRIWYFTCPGFPAEAICI